MLINPPLMLGYLGGATVFCKLETICFGIIYVTVELKHEPDMVEKSDGDLMLKVKNNQIFIRL